QVVDHTEADRAAHAVRLPGGTDHHHVARVPGGPQPGDDVQAEQIRQVQVQQHEVGAEFTDGGDRLLTGAGHTGHAEGLHPCDVGAVHPGHPEVVVDHEHVDRVVGH